MVRYHTGGSGDHRSVVWNPGAAASPDYVLTWADVMAEFAASTGEFTVYLDDSGGGAFSVPVPVPPANYDLQSRFSFARIAPAVAQVTVTVADGAVLQDLAGVYRNITLQVAPTLAPALVLSDGAGIEFDLGSVLENVGGVPALERAAGTTGRLSFYRDSSVVNSGAEVVDMVGASTLLATFQSNSVASVNWMRGAAAATLTYVPDSTFTRPTLATPPGTIGGNPSLFYPGAGVLAGCWSDGNPGRLVEQVSMNGVASPSGTAITTLVARCVSFVLPFPLLVNRVRALGAGVAAANDIQIALYRYSTLQRLTAAIDVGGTADGAWISLANGLGLQLQANTMYFLAVASRLAAGNTALMGFATATGKTTTAGGRIPTLPSAMPGSLAASAGHVPSQFFQFATVAGALPDPANALVAQGNWTGGPLPAIWLDNLDV